jgi:putative addiction module antidote
MVKKITARQVGGSIGTTLPKDMAERFRIMPGDQLLAIETNDGILLTPYDPITQEALALSSKAARKYRNALRELAK